MNRKTLISTCIGSALFLSYLAAIYAYTQSNYGFFDNSDPNPSSHLGNFGVNDHGQVLTPFDTENFQAAPDWKMCQPFLKESQYNTSTAECATRIEFDINRFLAGTKLARGITFAVCGSLYLMFGVATSLLDPSSIMFRGINMNEGQITFGVVGIATPLLYMIQLSLAFGYKHHHGGAAPLALANQCLQLANQCISFDQNEFITPPLEYLPTGPSQLALYMTTHIGLLPVSFSLGMLFLSSVKLGCELATSVLEQIAAPFCDLGLSQESRGEQREAERLIERV